jgi:2-C-methyl-D-erythritol 4-phosphate cytidylyltransferase
VREAIRALPAALDVIVIHDAARPLVTGDAVERCIRAARGGTGAVVGHPATDTMKEVDDAGRITATPERARLWHAQTPQAFPAAMVRAAYEALKDPARVTDDASVVELSGGTVVMVEGSARNLKVTRPEDLPLAELYLRLAAEGASAREPS